MYTYICAVGCVFILTTLEDDCAFATALFLLRFFFHKIAFLSQNNAIKHLKS